MEFCPDVLRYFRPILIKFGTGDVHKYYWGRCELCESVSEFVSVLEIMPLDIAEFLKNWSREGGSFFMAVHEVTFTVRVYCETV